MRGALLVISLLALAPSAASAQPRPAQPPAEEGTTVRVSIPGELQLRYSALTDITLPVSPSGASSSATLGQNLFFEGWMRFRPSVSFGRRFRVQFQFDLARMVAPDASTRDVSLAREPRDALLPYGLFDMRWGYVEWDSPFGQIRLGQQGFTWGYGILANDGDQTPLFGDYRYGDIVERLSLATRPGGRSSDVVLAVAADLVYRDRVASLADGDIAAQGVVAAFYQDHACTTRCEQRRVGALATYRDVSFRDGTFLRVFAGDVLARWEWPTPDRTGRVFAGVELALVAGDTDVGRSAFVGEQRVLQFGGAAELGIERAGAYRFSLEGGYASGDRNPIDGVQRQFTFNPSHRVGMILFPELMAWESARSAAIAGDPALAARSPTGLRLLPTNGAPSGAAYLYPTARIELSRHVDVRAGAVIAFATTDRVDPASVQLYGTPRNARGGDASRRDLGLELDLGVNARLPLTGQLAMTGGVQGAILFPGAAFQDATGVGPGRIGMATARVGMEF